MSDKIKFIELINHINKIYEVNSCLGRWITYEIYKTGSFSKAVKSIYIPAGTKHFREKPEASLGQQLFERSSFPVQLTEAGRAYIKR